MNFVFDFIIYILVQRKELIPNITFPASEDLPLLRKRQNTEKVFNNDFFVHLSNTLAVVVSFYPRESSFVLFNFPFKNDLSQAVFKSSKLKTDSLVRSKTLKVKSRDPPLANLSPPSD